MKKITNEQAISILIASMVTIFVSATIALMLISSKKDNGWKTLTKSELIKEYGELRDNSDLNRSKLFQERAIYEIEKEKFKQEIKGCKQEVEIIKEILTIKLNDKKN